MEKGPNDGISHHLGTRDERRGPEEMRTSQSLVYTVPFLIVQPSRVMDPLTMAEIGHLSQVTLRLTTGQKDSKMYFFLYFSTL